MQNDAARQPQQLWAADPFEGQALAVVWFHGDFTKGRKPSNHY